MTTLALTLGRPAEAETVLNTIASSISDGTAALELGGTRSVLDAFLGRTLQAAEAAAGVITHPQRSPTATHLAGWGLAMACGGLGRLEQANENLTRIDARADPGLHQATVVVALWGAGAGAGGSAASGRKHCAAVSTDSVFSLWADS